MSQLVLYDLPSRDRCACWSLNPWKTRIALNYKGLDYKTEWTEYPDIAPKFKSFGIEPNAQPIDPNAPRVMPYTIPTLRFDDKTVIMDSKKIVAELEKRYPEPSLHLDSPALAQVEALLPKLALPIRTLWMPRVCNNLLNPESQEYFRRTREGNVGMSLEEFEKSVPEDQAFKQAEPAFREAAELLKKNGGPFVLGKQVSYADFVLVTALQFMKRANEEGIFDRIIAFDPSFKTLYDACAKWLERDDH